MSERTYDLAGFNPAQPRTAGGTWGSGGAAKGKDSQKALLARRTALRAQVKHLREVLASLSPHHSGKVGTHAGAAGKHAGPKGTKAKAAKKGGKAKAAAHGHAAGAAGGGSGGGGPSLAAQVHALSSEVLALKRAIARAQARKHRHVRR